MTLQDSTKARKLIQIFVKITCASAEQNLALDNCLTSSHKDWLLRYPHKQHIFSQVENMAYSLVICSR